MSKRVLLGSLLGTLFVLFGWLGLAQAQEFRSGNSASIGSAETIDSSAYISGRDVDIAGRVNGDVFCAGQNITVSGTVMGDLICGGQTITITGTVEGDVRAAAQTVAVSGNVQGSLTVGAQSLTLDGKSRVGGDLTGGVESAHLNGIIGRDVVAGASEMTITGTVGRNVKAGIERLNLTGGTKVGGNIDYTSHNEVNRANGATVGGSVHRSEPKAKAGNGSEFSSLGFRVYWFFAMLLIALALVLLFPAVFKDAAEKSIAAPGKTIVVGVITTLLTPALFIVLLITIIGIPLALLLILMWILVLALSGPFFSYLVGRLVWKEQQNPIWLMLAGSAIVLIVYNIPFINILAMIVAVFFGTGMFLREAMRRTPKPKYK